MTEGIVLLDKPAGLTSFQSLGALKRRLGTGKVGHAGTLDRFAEGLLVVLVGRMTRLAAFATSLDKEYVAVVTFGRGTDTLDPEGQVTAEGSVPSREDVEEALARFRGSYRQMPPSYSAIHVHGRRAYHVARAGEEPDLAPREVRVDRLQLISYGAPDATLLVACSKGTYIRSLARDIAALLGTCAYVSRLRRTRVGGFRVEEAKPPEAFDPQTDVLPPARLFDAAPGLQRLVLKESWIASAEAGAPLAESWFERVPEGDGLFGAFSSVGRLVAVIERKQGAWRYAAAFPERPS